MLITVIVIVGAICTCLMVSCIFVADLRDDDIPDKTEDNDEHRS